MSPRTASLSRCVESGRAERSVLSAISSSHRLRAYSSFAATASSCREPWSTFPRDRSGRKCRGIRWIAGSSTARYARRASEPSFRASGSERIVLSASSATRRAFNVAERAGDPPLRRGVSPVVGMERLSRRRPRYEDALSAIPAATLSLHDYDATVAQRHVGRLPEGGGSVVRGVGREREAMLLLGARPCPREQSWLLARFLVRPVTDIVFAQHFDSSFIVSVGVPILSRIDGHYIHTCRLS